MSSISMYCNTFTNEDEIVKELARVLELDVIDDSVIIDSACKKYSLCRDKVEQMLYGKTSVFNHFTFERERCAAYLKLALSSYLIEPQRLFSGFISFLIPPEITHIVKILVSDTKKARIRNATMNGIPEEEALRVIKESEYSVINWVDFLYQSDAFSTTLYDIVMPAHKILSFDGFETLKDIFNDNSVEVTNASMQAVSDLAITSQVEIALLENGHKVGVNVHNGDVLLLVTPDTLGFCNLTNKLSIIASSVEGVKSVEINKGEGCRFTIFRDQKFELPPKVLLVDDEKDFVQTLSERLMVRNFGSHAVYDGQEALDFIKHDNPDVMVIDFRMPGMNGLEVLAKVKKINPKIEVIMLSGYGTLENERTSMELGAFAFLHKPADLEKLSDTIKAAYDKIAADRKRVPSRPPGE